MQRQKIHTLDSTKNSEDVEFLALLQELAHDLPTGNMYNPITQHNNITATNLGNEPSHHPLPGLSDVSPNAPKIIDDSQNNNSFANSN